MTISEDFLHYIWKNRLFMVPLYLTTGEEVEVLDVGQHNQDSGPDFFNAKIRIEKTVWAGNVEIHIRTSDWFKHGHHDDGNYQNIILHVVYQNDAEISCSDNHLIPTSEIRFPPHILDSFSSLLRNTDWVPCGTSIRNVDPLILNLWLDRLMIERMEQKASDIIRNHRETRGDWKETIYRQLARNFGFKINGMAFELLSKSLPLKFLERHYQNLTQTEALLFGQAGFLEIPDGDDYFMRLKNEYGFLQKKYNLKPMNHDLWKFLRMRPVNFPTIRIAQFAVLLGNNPGFLTNFLEHDPEIIHQGLRSLKPSGYWDDHYLFNKPSVLKKKTLGNEAVYNIIINTLIPVYFEYGRQTGKDQYRQKAVEFLEKLPPESNNIIKGWINSGVNVPNAFYSQALIQLKNNYCNFKKCLFCQVGNQILR
jgi:hypothetical protein